MAFHTPDPKLREVELQNARHRAAAFAWLFGCIWRGLKRLAGVRRASDEAGQDAATPTRPQARNADRRD